MADRFDISRTNPAYDAARELWEEGRDLFEGVKAVKAKRERYLYRGKNEQAEDYNIRLKRAALDPYIEKIIKWRNSWIFAKDADRSALSGLLSEIEPDVDGASTPAGTFFRDVCRDAQVDGLRFVLIDAPPSPVSPDGSPLRLSERQRREAGLRPFMRSVPRPAVIDWQFGADQMLDWCVIHETAPAPRAFGHEAASVEQWRVWTRSDWSVWRRSDKTGNGGKADFVLAEEGPNLIGEVPVVAFYGAKRGLWAGDPVCKSLHDHVLLLYNKESDLDHYERISAHPVPYVISAEKPDRIQTTDGAGVWIQSSPSGTSSVGYLEPTGAGFEANRKSIEDIRHRVLSIALAQAKKDTAQVQSADSQREDRKAFAASLKTVAAEAEASERECWRIASLYLGTEEVPEIVYARDFDNRLLDASLIQVLATMQASGQITLEALLGMLVDSEILPEDTDIEEMVIRMQDRMDRQAAEASGTSIPPSQDQNQ